MPNKKHIRPHMRKQALLERIRQTPGLAVAQMQSHCPGGNFEQIYQPLLEELVAEGLVFSHKFPWSETVFWYEAGYDVGKLFRPATVKFGEVRSYIDPTYKSAWSSDAPPVRQSIADIPTESPWKPIMPDIEPFEGYRQQMTQTDSLQHEICHHQQKDEKTSGDRRNNPNLDRLLVGIESAVEQAITDGTYRLPSRNELSLRLELRNYFYTSTPAGEAARKAYEDAQERLDDLKKARQRRAEAVTVIDTSIPVDTAQIDVAAQLEQARQKAIELEKRNRELRQQLAVLQETQPQRSSLVEVAIPSNYFEQQAQLWQKTIDELEADLASARANHAAYQRLMLIHEPVINVALNGDRSSTLQPA